MCQGVPTSGIYSWGKSDISGVTMDTAATELQYLWVGGLESGCACTSTSSTHTHTHRVYTNTHTSDTWSFWIPVRFNPTKLPLINRLTHTWSVAWWLTQVLRWESPPYLLSLLFILSLLTWTFLCLPCMFLASSHPHFLSAPLLHSCHSDWPLIIISLPAPHLLYTLSFWPWTDFIACHVWFWSNTDNYLLDKQYLLIGTCL